MNSIMNHGPQQGDLVSSYKNDPTQVKTPSQSGYINNNNSQVYRSKNTMQQLYKNQLDSFMQQKQKQRKFQKQIRQKQKQQYRQRVRIGQENQKMKDLAYKNYYKMLMESQDHNNQTYISPYQIRDKLKDVHIQTSIQQQMKRSQNYEYEKRMRELERKKQYKDELMRQMQERKKSDYMKKQLQQQQNQFYRQNTKVPQEIEAYEKERKKEQMNMYKHDLDKILEEKMFMSRKTNQINSQTQPRLKNGQDYHNPLINPLPYNIQNPYILKQMQKQVQPQIRNDSYLYQNQMSWQQKGRDQPQQRPRNQSSYFAKQGNILIK